MAKQQRMATVTAACAACAVLPAAWRPEWAGLGVMSAALLLVVAGGVVTVVRRLRRIARALREGSR
jgi:hypothetical protein